MADPAPAPSSDGQPSQATNPSQAGDISLGQVPPAALPIAETVPSESAQPSVVPETVLPVARGSETVIPETQHPTGTQASSAGGDGTMDIDEPALPAAGPSTILEGIAGAAQAVVDTVKDAASSALESVLPSTSTGTGQQVDNADAHADPPTAQPNSSAQVTARPADIPRAHSDSPFNAAASSSRAPSVVNGIRQRGEFSTPLPPPRPRTYRTGYIYDVIMMLHCVDAYQPTDDDQDFGSLHPEEPMRIKRIFQRLRDAGLVERMKKLDGRPVSFEQAMLVHTEDHWAKVEGTQEMSDEIIQQTKHFYDQLSLYVCRDTAHCARLSCGGVIQACVSVCTGEVRNAFAIVRPPGHHAEPDEHMGFCFYNNVAVAAKEVQRMGLAKKVLILDWDVHHGNGTQRAFWEDPTVLYMSIHRHEGGTFYPTSDFGGLDMVGGGAGAGTSVNVPWPGAGHGDADYIYAFQRIIMPIAYEFAPDLVIISAGFDAARGDTLGGCDVTPAAYGHMTHMLCAVAGGKVVVALEGGYNLDAISNSSVAVAQVLLGETPPELPQMQAGEVATEVMYEVAKVQSKYWKSIDVKACEPPEVADEGDIITRRSIPDILKIHRAHHMFTKHGLYQIPLASEELQAMFEGQVICSPTVYEAGEKSTLVVFVHDFGNLRVETDGVATTNIHLTNSYLLDTSDHIVDWVTQSKYSLIDVNVLTPVPDLPTKTLSSGKNVVLRGLPDQSKLMRYLWDNYIELSESENVVLLGHGSGCQAVVDLVNNRDVEHKVKAVIQVAGLNSLVRIDPKNESKGVWFRSSSRIYVPITHPILDDERSRRRAGGQIIPTDEATKVVDVLNAVLPQIKEFVEVQVRPRSKPSLEELPNGHGGQNGDEAHGGVNGELGQLVNGYREGDVGPNGAGANGGGEDTVMADEAGSAPAGAGGAAAGEGQAGGHLDQRQGSIPPPVIA